MALLVMLLALAAPMWAQARRPAAPEQLFQEAFAAQQRGDDATAIRKYRELLKLQPGVLEVHANLGAVLARQERFDEAIREYRAALAKQDYPALRMNLALAYYKKGALQEAVKELEGLNQSGDVRVATLLADCYAQLKRDARVLEVLGPVEMAHPEDLGVAWILGAALIRTGHLRDGLERVEKVARRGNNAEAFLLAGQTALRLDEFELARDHANAAMKLNPKLPGVLTLRGTVLSYLGDPAEAAAALRGALEVNPNDADAHLALGAVLHTERDLEAARKHLERAVALNPASNLARYQMARLERAEGKLEAAVKRFEAVIREDPKWAQPHIELAALYFQLNRVEDGERERAVFDRLSATKEKR